MGRRALIHVGMHKAGSTYLQVLMRKNRDGFHDAGITVMTNAKPDMHPFNDAARLTKHVRHAEPPFEPQRLFRRISKIEPANDLFFSCESLESLGRNPRALAKLHGFLAGSFDEVSYMIVQRNPVDHASSMVQQGIKTLRRKKYIQLGDFLKNYRLDRKYAAFLKDDYKVIHVDFDDFAKGDTTAFLSRTLGDVFDRAPPLADAGQANTSIGAKGVAIALCLNWLIHRSLGRGLATRAPNRKQISKTMVKELRASQLDDRKFVAFTPAEQERMLDSVIGSGQRFMDRFGLSPDANVFRARPAERTLCLLSHLPEPEREAAVQKLRHIWDMIEPLIREDYPDARRIDTDAAITEFMKGEGRRVGFQADV